MTVTDIRNLPDDEIASEVQKLRARIFKIKFQGKGANVDDPGSLKLLKKDVARMLTVLRERQLAQGGKE
ncbi:MAG: 50S ribosomal protein L29 [Planctomycetes bacterium]|nr:50S ribosomal protein L29 [Planctomycetota bacterium]